MKRLSLLIVLLILLVSATAVLAAPAENPVSGGAGLTIDGPDGSGEDVPVFFARPVRSKTPPVLSCPTARTSARYIAPRCVWP